MLRSECRYKLIEIDDAISFLLELARHPRQTSYSNYGYEIYLPNIIHAFLSERDGARLHGYITDQPEAKSIYPQFCDAAWELCRRGILRPGLKKIGGQATGASGEGYLITAVGRAWLKTVDEISFVSTEPSRFGQMAARFQDRLGDGYF